MPACSKRVDDFVACLTAVIMLRSCRLPQSVFVFHFQQQGGPIANVDVYVCADVSLCNLFVH